MSDAVDRLAQALRDVINEAVQEAVAARRPAPRDTPHVRGQETPGDLVEEEIRREYEKRFGEPAPKVWGERRLISVAEVRHQLGGIGHSTFYSLVKQGELSLVKIGRRSFVRTEELDDFLRRKRYGGRSGRHTKSRRRRKPIGVAAMIVRCSGAKSERA
jgi:excisionase family DNA binding protein